VQNQRMSTPKNSSRADNGPALIEKIELAFA
jgi:hypothetical protein